MSNVSLIKSRFFVENKDFDDAMEKVFNGGDYADWRVDYTRDAFDPTKKPSPFTDVDSLLKAFGFSTFKASDESIWIVDFKDSILSDFEFRNMVKVLLILSSFNLESFICIKEDEVEYLIEGGDLKNPRDYRSRPNFSDFKVGRSPFPPHFFNS